MGWSSRRTRWPAWIAALAAAAGAVGDPPVFAGALEEPAPLAPRPLPVKPARTEIGAGSLRDVITVKFRDDLPVRARGGALAGLPPDALAGAAPLLAALPEARWAPAYDLPEERLAALRRAGERRSGRALADFNTQIDLFLPPGSDVAAVIDALNALDCVEIALPCPRPAPPPLPPNFQPSQVYENPAPSGIGAETAWSDPGVVGAGVRIADIEYDWNLGHLDLPPTAVLGFQPVNPFNDDHHGTAVLGQLGAIANGWGVTGIAHGASLFVAATWDGAVWNVGAAVLRALDTLEAGDVILIEQQVSGPGGDFVPVEWVLPWYDTIVAAVASGVVVVEAAANGGVDLDAPIYSTGNSGHWPFLPQNDSGAIIVGAGAAAAGFGSDVPGSRLSFSNYGSTVDLQGWGQGVWTTGYGGAWSSEGLNLYYTSGFAGTSSASPIVAGACALLQSAHLAATGAPLTPAEVRDFLRETGLPQTSGAFPASQNIGPRPDVPAAIAAALTVCDPILDCNANGVHDACDLAGGSSLDCDGNLVPDECDVANEPRSDCNANGLPDGCETLALFEAASPVLAPLTPIQPLTWTIEAPPPAAGDVVITLSAHADLNQHFEVVHVEINGEPVGTLFITGASDCADPPDEDSLLVPAAGYNAAIAGDPDAEMTLIASGGIDPGTCPAGSLVSATLSYPIVPANDADGDGVPDDCDPCPSDLNGDGSSGFGDLSALLAAWGPCPAPCAADLDGGGAVGFGDLNVLLEAWGSCP